VEKAARFSDQERRELFRETGSVRGMSPAVVEKDFWVCWTLGRLFGDPELREHMVFKGGTSLSKVFGLIDRFSEDIDLVLDWRLLGYGERFASGYPEFTSRTQQDRFNMEVNRKAAAYIGGELLVRLNALLGRDSKVVCAINPDDPQTVNVTYPAAFSENYLRPEIWLEIGPLASFVPSSIQTITPYAAESFARLFENPSCEVVAIDAERTFWEKATILHQQSHRATVMPTGYSRHYYDLYKLAKSEVKTSAFEKLDLLSDVTAFKERFYPSTWARYDLARAGSFRLTPGAPHLAELERDYGRMAVMIYGGIPPFPAILETLRLLEAEINSLEQGSSRPPLL
jgi:hypothetical protein